MAKAKINKVKYPNESYLREIGLTNSAINTLTGQIGKSHQKATEVAVHEAVLKMNKSLDVKDKLSKKDLKRRDQLLNVKNKEKNVIEKLELLGERKKNFENTKKLDYELMQEERRKKAKQSRNSSLIGSADYEKLNKMAADTFINNTNVSKKKIKQTSSHLTNRNVSKADLNNLFQLKDNKKFSFKKSEPKSIIPVRGASLLSKFDYLSESSKHFAKELGWIEDDRQKRIFQSPLKNYKTENNEKNVNEEDIKKTFSSNTSNKKLNDKNLEEHEDNKDVKKELDLKTIDDMVKKYTNNVEKINKQKVKRQIEAINVSQITKKILDQSPLAKLSRDNNKKVVAPKGVDINKIPSIVFDRKK
ncbi:hypothetical protein [Spiroplasma tabanidicola]|uniref:Uncharacterized protein n=1 Tax=Spiroplasma tabanidicola TaxID=324079 RepID=A0A6I6CA32_9MOLU|nr:hypothetical protein [Spiroplasma tabanidicola]QGS51795.1 hypothetical protein STABA_v1c04320 [Spiroplasma tabanidicola]